ncbi:MAG TPA: hypothetical protein VGI58_20685 [Streptosporangiaceae bacterium]|jgi:hypothetical protein
MVVPLAARYVAAVVGVLLVLSAGRSVLATLIVPRSVGTWVTKRVDQCVNGSFVLITRFIREYARRDQILAANAAAILIGQLIAWLGMFFVGFSLLFWPLVHGGITDAFRLAGPGLWQIGEDRARGSVQETIIDIATITSLITITLQIAYLPTLYSEFNRRENEIALLNARAGVPSWGPELLARTYYALGTGVSSVDTLPDLYKRWEAWAAEVAESHTTYLPLVRFRSPKPKSSWVTSLLAVLDSAALILSLSPSKAPVVPARLCLRAGFSCFQDIAGALGFHIPENPDASAGISITYEQFLEAIARMRQVDFPIERKPEDAWADFVGWRVNYEQAAYAIAREIDAVPALWSGPRRHEKCPQIPPARPPSGRPGGSAGKTPDPADGLSPAADQDADTGRDQGTSQGDAAAHDKGTGHGEGTGQDGTPAS